MFVWWGFIPEAVYEEVTTNEEFQDEAEQIRQSDFLKVVSIDDEKAISILQRVAGLDRGESEAIIYADENRADYLLMEEVPGRKAATDMGLRIMGSISVITNAAKDGHINDAEAEMAFEKIRNSNRHISEKIIMDALAIIRNE